eukprot:1161080-Pelagomonas_calceolata.AAC.14
MAFGEECVSQDLAASAVIYNILLECNEVCFVYVAHAPPPPTVLTSCLEADPPLCVNLILHAGPARVCVPAPRAAAVAGGLCCARASSRQRAGRGPCLSGGYKV